MALETFVRLFAFLASGGLLAALQYRLPAKPFVRLRQTSTSEGPWPLKVATLAARRADRQSARRHGKRP